MIECSIWDVKVPRVDAKNNKVSIYPKLEVGQEAHEVRQLRSTGASILLRATRMMTIDFDKDVGQRVLDTDNISV